MQRNQVSAKRINTLTVVGLAMILMPPNGRDNIQDECGSILKEGKFCKER